MPVNYKIGDIVYLRTDPDQLGQLITGIIIRETHKKYLLKYIANETEHWEFEFTNEKDMVKKLE